MLSDIAAWAGVIGLPFGIIGSLAGIAALGRQRGIRQQLREALDPVVRYCDAYQRGLRDYLTGSFLHVTSEKLRVLSEREGLKSPNRYHIDELRHLLEDIAGRFEIPQELPRSVLTQQELAELLEANSQRLIIGVEEAKRRAARYIDAVNGMDSWHYLTYLRFKRFGITSRTFPELPPDYHPWTRPVQF